MRNAVFLPLQDGIHDVWECRPTEGHWHVVGAIRSNNRIKIRNMKKNISVFKVVRHLRWWSILDGVEIWRTVRQMTNSRRQRPLCVQQVFVSSLQSNRPRTNYVENCVTILFDRQGRKVEEGFQFFQHFPNVADRMLDFSRCVPVERICFSWDDQTASCCINKS